jgi:hypothetical protein
MVFQSNEEEYSVLYTALGNIKGCHSTMNVYLNCRVNLHVASSQNGVIVLLLVLFLVRILCPVICTILGLCT